MINENAEAPAPNAGFPVADVDSLPVSSITLKHPSFWPNDPLVWFPQVEASFHTGNISSQPIKFVYIGDRKPVQLLRKMGQLVGEQYLEEGICH